MCCVGLSRQQCSSVPLFTVYYNNGLVGVRVEVVQNNKMGFPEDGNSVSFFFAINMHLHHEPP